MRNLMLALLAAIMVLLAVPSASAQSKLHLGRSSSGRILLSAEGGGSFSLRLCAKVVDRKCVGDLLEGPAWASGEFGHDRGFYILKGKAITDGTFTGCVGTTCSWTLDTMIPFLTLDFNSQKNGKGTDFLSGVLKMLALTAVPQGKIILCTITVDLTVTGGTLAPYFDDELILLYEFTTGEHPL